MTGNNEAAAAAAAVRRSGGNLGFQDALDYDMRTAATVDEAAKDVVDVFAGALGWGIFEHLTFREADVLATLAYRAGRADVAQAMMLEWAELDDDAGESWQKLQDWGIEAGPDGWNVTGGVSW